MRAPWKHTVITTDGVQTSESWAFSGALFRGYVTRDGLRWKGSLRRTVEHDRKVGPSMTQKLAAGSYSEVTSDTADGAMLELEAMVRDEWLAMPESKWDLPTWEAR